MEFPVSTPRPRAFPAAALTAAACAATALAGPAFASPGPAPAVGLKAGLAHIGFNTRSGDLAGPPGTTPPGVQAALVDTRTLALVLDLPLSAQWGVVLQMGTPPIVHFDGAGSGAALGEVGSARAWFPALLARWQPAPWGALQPYAAFGINHTFYTGIRITPAYSAAFGGSSSRARLKASQGPVFKLGAEWRIDPHWDVDVAYARYGIRTTATVTTPTPGLGDVTRTLALRADPDVFSLMLGRRF